MDNMLKEINKISLKFLKSFSLEDTYKKVVDEAVKLVKTESGAVYLKNHEYFYLSYSSLKGIREKHPVDSFISKAHRGRKAFLIQPSKLSDSHAIFQKKGIKSLVYIPLCYKSKSIGVLVLFSKKDLKLPVQSLEALELFGSISSLTIQRAKLFEEKEKALEDRNQSIELENILEKINYSALKFLYPISLKETYARIVQESIKLVDGDEGFLLLENNKSLERVYFSSEKFLEITPRREGHAYKAFKKNIALIIHEDEIKRIHPEAIGLGIKSTIFIPLSNKGEVMGVMVVMSFSDKVFHKKQLNILRLFGSLASLAIKKADLQRETQKALELRDRFIAIAAHEFRTPLTSINGYVQLLFQKLSEQNTTESRWMEQLNFETKRLTALVNELLEINRIKAGKLNYLLKECSIREIVRRAYETFSFSSNANVLIEDCLNSYDKVVGDPEKLEQVVLNLLDNAVKFSARDKKVIIKLFDSRKFLTVSVKDFGPGIPKEEIPMILQGFYKKGNDIQAGMGLGFYLINNIVKLHRGNLKIISKLKKGTTVEIKLPKIKI